MWGGTSRHPVHEFGSSIPESHYSLLVGDPLTETDLHYWDGLANQDEVIRLSVDEDYYEGRSVPDVNDSSLLIPPLDLCAVAVPAREGRLERRGADPSRGLRGAFLFSRRRRV